VIFKKNTKAKIAIDVMGGDNDPEACIDGINRMLKLFPAVECLLYGDERKIKEVLQKYPKISNKVKIFHTESKISSREKPSIALRNSKNTSMRMAIEAVKHGEADAVVSSGNTGALMAVSRVVLRTLPNINRPAIVAMVPTIKGTPVALVDAGANAECNEQTLFDFAVMGDAFAKIVFNLEKPRIALLNIGIEEVKGTEFIKNAMLKLKEAGGLLNLHGYVEGDGIVDGSVDVVVTDGFTGNVALKTIEGTAKLCEHYFKMSFSKSIFSKLGYLLARSSLKSTFKKIDYKSYNGAMFVGLNGVVVKSHGSADGKAFFYALNTAIDLVESKINDKITEELNSFEQIAKREIKPTE